eukprot:6293278-Prymnesium_polylepis.1
MAPAAGEQSPTANKVLMGATRAMARGRAMAANSSAAGMERWGRGSSPSRRARDWSGSAAAARAA